MKMKICVPVGGRIPVSKGIAVCVDVTDCKLKCRGCCFSEWPNCDVIACTDSERNDERYVRFELDKEGGEE